MSKKIKAPQKFMSEAAERAFWEAEGNDSTAHVDWSQAQRIVLPNLKPSTTAISLRLPVSLLDRLKTQANRLDVPYQSLLKVWLAERLAEIEHAA